MTGKQEGEQVSRLCKKDLLRRFVDLLPRLPSASGVTQDTAYENNYDEIKAFAQLYQVSDPPNKWAT